MNKVVTIVMLVLIQLECFSQELEGTFLYNENYKVSINGIPTKIDFPTDEMFISNITSDSVKYGEYEILNDSTLALSFNPFETDCFDCVSDDENLPFLMRIEKVEMGFIRIYCSTRETPFSLFYRQYKID